MSKIAVGDLVYMKYAYHKSEVDYPPHGVVTEIRADTLRSTKIENSGNSYSYRRLRKMHLRHIQDELWVYGKPVWISEITNVPDD